VLVESEHPRAGVDYPGTWQSFESWFPDDEACREFLIRVRWPDGFVCPNCGGTDAWLTGRGLWMCRSCNRQSSVTAGTIFHRSRLPLRTWFAAMWFVCSQKNGVSALGLQRVLGFGSYETAWAWLHKLRRAMVRPDRELLGGDGVTVEMDSTFIGGRSQGKRLDGEVSSVHGSSPSIGVGGRQSRPHGLHHVFIGHLVLEDVGREQDNRFLAGILPPVGEALAEFDCYIPCFMDNRHGAVRAVFFNRS